MVIPADDQVWRERDKRFVRFVRIVGVFRGWVTIRTCNEDGETIIRRVSRVAQDSFPKRFEFIKQAKGKW